MSAEFPLSIIILTKDEELNIRACLESVKWANEIFIVDSFSSDRTIEIARNFTDKIYQREFTGYAAQKNWALDNLPLSNDWILSLDADEQVTPELRDEIIEVLSRPSDICGYYIKRRMIFMGRWIRYGNYYPLWLLRIFLRKSGRFEERIMDEHLILQGKTGRLKNDFIDENKKGLAFWIEKLNRFSTLEAIARLGEEKQRCRVYLFGFQPQRRKWLKKNIYLKFPLVLRPLLYFFYRYFIKLGFLDGKQGLIYHFIQGCCYQLIIDLKMIELKKAD